MNISMKDTDGERAFGLLLHDGAPLSAPQAVSALIDGQLHGAAFAQVVEAVQGDAQMRVTWQAYHLVGDLLRQGEAIVQPRASGDFAARVAARLAAEPLPKPFGPTAGAIEIDAADALAPAPSDSADVVQLPARADLLRQAANDPLWRWRAAAGVATVMAFAAVGWNLLSGAVATSVASTPVLARAELPRQIIRDPRLDELLAAHEQSAGISALQMPAGFLRNATFEGRGR